MPPPLLYLPALRKAFTLMLDYAEDYDDEWHMGCYHWLRIRREQMAEPSMSDCLGWEWRPCDELGISAFHHISK